MKRSRTLRNSTAVAMVLALGLSSPAHLAFAQEGQPQVNCEENPDDPSCATPPEQPAAEEPAPAPQAEEPAPEQPAAEEPAPQAEEPAPEPQAQEPAPEPAPQAEEPAPEPQTEEPAPEQPAAEEPAPEPAPQAEEPAPEPQAEEPAPEQQPAAEEPAPEPVPQAEEPAPEPQAEESAPEQPAAEEPAPQPEAEQSEAEQPAAEEPAAEQPAETAQPEQPAAEETQAAEPQATEPAAEEQKQGEATEAVEVEEPTLVIPDDATQEQRQQVERQQKRSREEARDNRGELLGAAAVGAVIGALIPALGGKVVEDEGDRIIVERDGEYYVRKDESSLLRRGDAEVTVTRLRGGRTLETVTRRNGVVIETVRDEGGFVLKRTRILPNGREYVLIDNRGRDDNQRVDWDRRLPPIRVDIPRDRYIVPARGASRQAIYDTITAPPVEEVEQSYTLRDVRENERIRAKVRRVDLDTITFETGSAVVRRSQVPLLEDMAAAIRELLDQDPSAVVLVEGHTDAVGSETYNLALSDRRAETVAAILVDSYGIPPENLVTQGYGEQYLKVDTEQAEAQNRRATIRNITPLLAAQNQ